MILTEKLASLGSLYAAAAGSCDGSTDMLARLARLAETGDDSWTVLNVEDALSDALALARPRIVRGSIRLTRMIGSNQALTFGSRPQLTQAILHVLLNAIDAMPHGGGLTASCGREETERKGVGIVIRDTGPGIAPDILPRVFDPFFTTGRLGERTGLGLWSARSIIRQHDGEIGIETEVHKGTAVRIWLPAVVAVATDTLAAPKPHPTLSAA
jgi:signal transduction histidine kinase